MPQHHAIPLGKVISLKNTQVLDAVIKNACPKVSGISFMEYTRPQIVIVHCEGDPLTDEELEMVRRAVVGFTPPDPRVPPTTPSTHGD